MSFIVITLPDEPIVLLRADLAELVAADHLASLKARIRYLLAHDSPPRYLIWDLIGQDIMIYAIQLLMYDIQASPEGSIADPRLTTLIVSDHPVIAILLRKVRESFDVRLWQFYSVADALMWARQQSTHAKS